MPAIRRASSIRPVAFMVAAALTLATPAITPARAGSTHDVQIVGFAFEPAVLTVTVGDTVTWTNQDLVAHTATSTAGAFDSGPIGQGASYSVTFTAAGSYPYLCTPHPDMTGTIVVVAAAAAPTAAAPVPTAAAPVPVSAPGGGLPNVAAEAPGTAPSVALTIGGVLLLASLVVGARRARGAPG